MLVKVFPINLKPGKQAHTSSDAYKELIAGKFAGLITEFVEIDHELLAGI